MSQKKTFAGGFGSGIVLLLLLIIPFTTTGGVGTNNCNGTLTSYGRCEESFQTQTVTILGGAFTGTSTISFPTPFTNRPFVTITPTTNVTFANGIGGPPVALHFLTTKIFPWAIPAVKTEFGGNQSDEIVFDPTFYTNVQLTVDFSASTIPSAGSTIYGEISADGGSTWLVLTQTLVDGNGSCTIAGAGSTDFVCSNFAPKPALPALSVPNYLLRITGSGGDGVTKIQWSQITIQFLAPDVQPFGYFVTPLANSRNGFTLTFWAAFAPVSGQMTMNFVWKAVSETG